MVYLIGVTKAYPERVTHNRFKRLSIPFASYKEAERFIFSRVIKFKCKVYPMYLEK